MRNRYNTYKVVTTLEFVTYVEAETDDDALHEARELYPADVNVIVDEVVTLDDDDLDEG